MVGTLDGKFLEEKPVQDSTSVRFQQAAIWYYITFSNFLSSWELAHYFTFWHTNIDWNISLRKLLHQSSWLVSVLLAEV